MQGHGLAQVVGGAAGIGAPAGAHREGARFVQCGPGVCRGVVQRYRRPARVAPRRVDAAGVHLKLGVHRAAGGSVVHGHDGLVIAPAPLGQVPGVFLAGA